MARVALLTHVWAVIVVSVLVNVVVDHATDMNMAAATLGGAILAIPPITIKMLTTLVDKLQRGGQ